MATFNVDRVLRVLDNADLGFSLRSAMNLANELIGLHADRMNQVENEAYDRGHKEGYETGKRDVEVPSEYELNRLRRMETAVKANANELVKGIVNEIGSLKKIQCIKELRSKTGLGLKETKDIVDAYVLNLGRLSSWERAERDASYRL